MSMTDERPCIDPDMLHAMEKLRVDLIENGGRAEVWLVSPDTHDRYFGGATEVLGLPMLAFANVPERQTLICSRADLDHWAAKQWPEAANVN